MSFVVAGEVDEGVVVNDWNVFFGGDRVEQVVVTNVASICCPVWGNVSCAVLTLPHSLVSLCKLKIKKDFSTN